MGYKQTTASQSAFFGLQINARSTVATSTSLQRLNLHQLEK